MKEIYCFGTSQTAGGGYEFDSPSKWDWPEDYWFIEYEGEKTQSNFSYPGRLQSISNEYKVFNLGKSGHGNDRSIRKAYDVIKSNEKLSNKEISIIKGYKHQDNGSIAYLCKDDNNAFFFVQGEKTIDLSV